MAIIKQIQKYDYGWSQPYDIGVDAQNVDCPDDQNLINVINNFDSRITVNEGTIENINSSIGIINDSISSLTNGGATVGILGNSITGRVTNDQSLTIFGQKYNGLYEYTTRTANLKILATHINTLTEMEGGAVSVKKGGGYYVPSGANTGMYRIKISPGSNWYPLIALYPQFTNGTGGNGCGSICAWRHYLQKDGNNWYYCCTLRNIASSYAKFVVWTKVLCVYDNQNYHTENN